jgi:hypothetical protein
MREAALQLQPRVFLGEPRALGKELRGRPTTNYDIGLREGA